MKPADFPKEPNHKLALVTWKPLDDSTKHRHLVYNKVINIVPAIVIFFYYNKTYRIYVSLYRIRTVLNYKK